MNEVQTQGKEKKQADNKPKGPTGPSPNHPRPRHGKTRKDRANGAKAKNEQNKQSRAMWQGDSKRSGANFPYASCNGKRNRYQFTGKDGQTVFTGDKKK